MDKEQILNQLNKNHQSFVDFLNELNDGDCINSKNGKWSPLQNAEHINKSLWTMNLGLMTPKFLLKLFFGVSGQKSKSYDELIEFYQLKLKNGAKADLIYHPKSDYLANDRRKIVDSIRKNIQKSISLITLLTKKLHLLVESTISNFSENDLDNLKMPHPILNKVTIREMLYFTIYHVSHHHNSSKNLLETKQ